MTNVEDALLDHIESSLDAFDFNIKSLLLAVSGGVDSVALLRLFAKIAAKIPLQLAVAHVDHSLRKSSTANAIFVENLAKKSKMKFHLKTAKPESSKNLEAWGRAVRYEFFADLQKEFAYDLVLTAHTQDDQLETVLMQLCTNKTPRGISYFDRRRKLWRPLLKIPKQTLEMYLLEIQQGHEFDESNASTDFLRNKIRLQVLPKIEESLGKEALAALRSQAAALVADQAFIDDYCENLATNLNNWNFGSKFWLENLITLLEKESENICWRLVEVLFLPELGFKMGRSAALDLIELLLKQKPAANLPGGFEVHLQNGGLKLVKIKC